MADHNLSAYLKWALAEIDHLSNCVSGWAYPQGAVHTATLGRSDEEAVQAAEQYAAARAVLRKVEDGNG